MRFCTIVHPATLSHARVLARELAEHHDGARLTALVVGPAHLATRDEPFDVVRPEQLSAPGFERLLAQCRWDDLTELLKPHLLAWSLDDSPGAVVYLDPKLDLLAPLDPVVRALEDGFAVVVPRLDGELPADGRRPGERDLRQAGGISQSLIALAPGAASLDFASWWSKRLARAADQRPDPTRDQSERSHAFSRWLDLAPSLFDGMSVVADPGLAVSHWNLQDRRLARGEDVPTVDDRPLRFVHFEAFDPYRPFLLAPGYDRVRVSASETLAELCASYAERLKDAGWRDPRRRADVGRRMANGMTFDDRLSHLLAWAAAAGEEPSDIFSEEGTEALIRWARGRAFPGTSSMLSRYLFTVYRERRDLQVAYPDLLGADAEGFAGWAWVFGVPELEVPERFLPPKPASIEGFWAEPSRLALSLPRGDRPDLSMNVTGLLTGTLGLGEAARGYVRALQAAGVEVSTSTVDVREFVELSGTAHEGYARVEYADLAGADGAGFNLVCINADELPLFAESVGDEFFDGRPSIGVWAWETDHIPERWQRSFEFLDEIWVYSEYVAQNLARVSPIPVRRMPPPVSPPDAGNVGLDLGMPEGFRFLFMFDFFSTIQRKNPVGLLDAFRRAFQPGEGPQLVIKTLNGVHRPEALEEVLWAARARPDIHVIDRSLSAPERDALVAGCDCYVSLHRSEGFGLTLAECMALGKPVIGTAFSANTDFMTAENSYLVPHEMTRVGADCEVYPPEGTWADPDVAEAARLMRRVLEQPEEARAKGERARSDIERLYSPQAVGSMIRTRLEELAGLWPGGD